MPSITETPLLSSRYGQALVFAHEAHYHHQRKKTEIPYISHPMAVSSLVLEYGGNETEAIAGLLHDVLEDQQGDADWAGRIERRFGAEVLGIVKECSDHLPAEEPPKPPWPERKRAYLAGLDAKSPSALLVTACDKLHNLTAIARDHRHLGDTLWGRFSGRKDGTRWYYENLAHHFHELGVSPAEDLAQRLTELGWGPRCYTLPEQSL